jgi:hypothetical protein
MLRLGGEKIVIFDLDGTLADDGHRNHYLHPPHSGTCAKVYDANGVCGCGSRRDWASYFAGAGDDSPKPQVIQVCRDLARWHQIYILSGRCESTADVTRKWLRQQEVPYDKLKLRAIEDRTQDDVLKLQWVEDMGIKDRVICIFEDRQRVVDAWRAAGYTCFQVAPGNF